MIAAQKTGASQKREKLRDEFWPGEDVWTGDGERGWFRAPCMLPLILGLLGSKEFSANKDPTKVYLELLARHVDGGLIEMVQETDHAYAAGYVGSRAVRTWQERMKVLEKTGFIKTKRIGNRYKYVLLVHPVTSVQELRKAGKVPDEWWDAYKDRQIETKEARYEERMKAKLRAKVIPIKTAKASSNRKTAPNVYRERLGAHLAPAQTLLAAGCGCLVGGWGTRHANPIPSP